MVSMQNLSLSVNDLLACCGFLCGSGCDGGYPLYAWRYFVHHGVVTEEVKVSVLPNAYYLFSFLHFKFLNGIFIISEKLSLPTLQNIKLQFGKNYIMGFLYFLLFPISIII